MVCYNNQKYWNLVSIDYGKTLFVIDLEGRAVLVKKDKYNTLYFKQEIKTQEEANKENQLLSQIKNKYQNWTEYFKFKSSESVKYIV